SSRTWPITSTTSTRHSCRKSGSSACVVSQLGQRPRRTQIRRSSSSPGPTSQRAARWYQPHHVSGSGQTGHGCLGTSTPLPSAAYASTPSGHGHILDKGGDAPHRGPPRRHLTSARGVPAHGPNLSSLPWLAPCPLGLLWDPRSRRQIPIQRG